MPWAQSFAPQITQPSWRRPWRLTGLDVRTDRRRCRQGLEPGCPDPCVTLLVSMLQILVQGPGLILGGCWGFFVCLFVLTKKSFAKMS